MTVNLLISSVTAEQLVKLESKNKIFLNKILSCKSLVIFHIWLMLRYVQLYVSGKLKDK